MISSRSPTPSFSSRFCEVRLGALISDATVRPPSSRTSAATDTWMSALTTTESPAAPIRSTTRARSAG